MVKITQKIDGKIQDNVKIQGPRDKVLRFFTKRVGIPSFAIYQLKMDGFTRYQAGPHLIEIDIEPITEDDLKSVTIDQDHNE